MGYKRTNGNEPEGATGAPEGNTTDIENKINAALDNIIEESPGQEEPVRHRAKSARPGPVVYVPVDDLDEKISESVPTGKKKLKFKGLRVFGLLFLMACVGVGCAYGAASYYFSDRFFEGTWINGINCSHKTAYEVEQLLAKNTDGYAIEVDSRNLSPQTINGSDIDYHYVSSGEVLNLLKKQKPYEWIKGFYEQKSYTVEEKSTYNKTLLQDQVKALNCAQVENQVEPENAYVAFQDNQFVIVPETEGSKLDVKAAYRLLDTAVAKGETSVDFSSSSDAYVSAEVTQDDPSLQSTLEACNNYTKASINYTFGDQTVTLDGNTIKDWLQFDEKGQLVFDDNSLQQHIAEYVAQLAASYDTVGTEREFKYHQWQNRLCIQFHLWLEDRPGSRSSRIKSGNPVRNTDYQRTSLFQTANSYGVNDLGNTYIEVDLSQQHMYYYQNGSMIFDSDFVSGNMSYDDRQTHAGIFTMYYKKSPDVLRGSQKADGTYEYEEKVEYWMPFDGGIGFHDAPWRDEFGGDIYLTSGSHGCINLPPDNAAELYGLIQYNVPIVCFY